MNYQRNISVTVAKDRDNYELVGPGQTNTKRNININYANGSGQVKSARCQHASAASVDN